MTTSDETGFKHLTVKLSELIRIAMNFEEDLVILNINAKDIRWPTSLGGHGSDAMVCKYLLMLNVKALINNFCSILTPITLAFTLQ